MFSRQLQQVYLYGSKLSSPYHNSGEIPSVADNFRQKINDDDRQAMSALSTIREQLQDTKKTAEEFLRGADDIKKGSAFSW